MFYLEYLKCPSENLRQEIKQCYEAIPKPQRCYLGDMSYELFEIQINIGGIKNGQCIKKTFELILNSTINDGDGEVYYRFLI